MVYEATFKNRLIYIFSINDKEHAGALKIGEATAPDDFFAPNSAELNAAAKERINQYTQTAGIHYNLLHTEMTAFAKDGTLRSFNDKRVHDILQRSGIEKKRFQLDGGKATEWFICDLETAKRAIQAAKEERSYLNADQITHDQTPINFRPEQREAIEKTIKVFGKKDKMLWNAKMRMGKTLSTLEVIRRMNIHRTIIITHRPVVDDGWFEDYGKIFYQADSNFTYASKDKGESDIHKLLNSDKNVIYFASIQDLRGSQLVGGNFDKNKEIFKQVWDLLVIDEAHEGTQTELGQKVIDSLITEGKTKQLDLSGTAFNLLDKYDEESTFTWDYIMEQRAKQKWAEEHPGDPNPYEDLPRLSIFTFRLGELSERYADGDKAFNFREFFRVNDQGKFVHDADVERFLDVITSSKSKTQYPFCTEAYRELFHHTLWIVPGVKEGAALTEKLRVHSILGEPNYKIVNVAGKEDEDATDDALNDVISAIGEKPEETYTITISCGKLTTGVTVKPWTAVMYLAGGVNTSAQSYMQTIFRVQSPAVIGGKLKRECYVFDFAPDRTLKIIAETAKISAKAGKTTQNDRDILGEFLNFCPIVAMQGTEMRPYRVDAMLQQLKRAYVDRVVRSGFEDAHLYNDSLLQLSDIQLEQFANLRGIIGHTKANKQGREITMNNQGFTEEDIEREQREAKRNEKKAISVEEALRRLEEQRRKRQRDEAVSILRGVSIRMPLLIFGADLQNEEDDLTLDQFVALVDDQSWKEFMPKNVTKDLFAQFRRYYDEDVFSAAAKQIRSLARAADNFTVDERVRRIADIFQCFRNPDKETVLTPWRVVNMHLSDTLGGYCFYNDDFSDTLETPRFVDRGLVTTRLFDRSDVHILEINSKTGLYPLYMAYGIYQHRLKTARQLKAQNNIFKELTMDEERDIWRQTVQENIFVICMSPMARGITQRTLLGFMPDKANTHVYDDLVNQLRNRRSEFISRLTNGQIFKQIKNNMKFDAIVGNPPYQLVQERTSDDPIYHKFIDLATDLSDVFTLITPARYLFNAGKTPAEWNKKILNDPHFKIARYEANSTDIFPNVDIKGGVAICYRNKNDYYGPIIAYTAYPELGSILQKVQESGKSSISNIIYMQNKFNISTLVKKYPGILTKIGSDGKERRLTTSIFALSELFSTEAKTDKDIKVLGLVKNKREWRYIDSSLLEKHPNTYKYKVIVPKSNGSGAIGEILSTPLIGEPLIGEPLIGVTQSFITFGAFDNNNEAVACLKYIKTKFVRALLGILKVTQDNSKETWQFVPLQDFTSSSDIDWRKSVAEIDQQLYSKYGLTEDEIAFVERTIKPMDN